MEKLWPMGPEDLLRGVWTSFGFLDEMDLMWLAQTKLTIFLSY